jgi:transposase-like protein
MRHYNDIETTRDSISLQKLADRFPTEQACRDYLEAIRWNGHITCPHCSSDRVHKFTDGKLYFCSACRKQFTVKVGTIFEDSHTPLRKWFFAVFIIVAHRKGISSLQLSRDLQVTQKTAWYMNHRIRYAIAHKSFNAPLGGGGNGNGGNGGNPVEVDETYVGGKTRRLGDPPLKRGRGSERQTPVIGVVERGGDIVAIPIQRVTIKNLMRFIRENVQIGARIMTDEFMSYQALNQDYKHETVNHSKREYVRGDVYTNTIESYFSQLKRGIFGIYHSVSSKHLARYCNEFAYRWNIRRVKDADRFVMALQRCENENRLTYRTLTGGKQSEETKKQPEDQTTQRAS